MADADLKPFLTQVSKLNSKIVKNAQGPDNTWWIQTKTHFSAEGGRKEIKLVF